MIATADEEWPADLDIGQSIVYLLVVDASGEITDLRHQRGPEIPRIEDELNQTVVIQAGSYDNNPEAYECIIEIKLSDQSPDNGADVNVITSPL